MTSWAMNSTCLGGGGEIRQKTQRSCVVCYLHIFFYLTCMSTFMFFCFVVLPSKRTVGFCGAEHLNHMAQSLGPNGVGQSRHHLSENTLPHTMTCFLFLFLPFKHLSLQYQPINSQLSHCVWFIYENINSFIYFYCCWVTKNKKLIYF